MKEQNVLGKWLPHIADLGIAGSRYLCSSKLLVIVASFLAAGCSSMGDILKSKADGGGTVVEYEVNRDQAYDICMAIFRWEGSDAIEEHKSQGYMLTSWSRGEGGGSVAGAFVEPGAKNATTKVTAITMRRSSLSFTTSLTESTFHTLFERSVKIVKSGEQLPLTKPKKGT